MILCPLCPVSVHPELPHEHHLPRVEDPDPSDAKFVESLASGHKAMADFFAKQEGGGDE